jgi:prevent-host-death family protein
LNNFNINFNFALMKTVSMLQFRKDAERVLRRVARGERFVLSHRGKPAARLEPVHQRASVEAGNDPFLNISRRAKPSPKGPTRHQDIDQILYGGS